MQEKEKTAKRHSLAIDQEKIYSRILSVPNMNVILIHSPTLQLHQSLTVFIKKYQENDTSHFTFPSIMHSRMDDEWHTTGLTLVISLLNPLCSNYVQGEQKLAPGNYG